MVIVVELFTLAFIRVTPSKLGFESMGLLGQVLFSEMLWVVSATVSEKTIDS